MAEIEYEAYKHVPLNPIDKRYLGGRAEIGLATDNGERSVYVSLFKHHRDGNISESAVYYFRRDDAKGIVDWVLKCKLREELIDGWPIKTPGVSEVFRSTDRGYVTVALKSREFRNGHHGIAIEVVEGNENAEDFDWREAKFIRGCRLYPLSFDSVMELMTAIHNTEALVEEFEEKEKRLLGRLEEFSKRLEVA